MNPSEYRNWLQRACLSATGSLCQELATPFQAVITEDVVRAALMKGFALSNPQFAHFVHKEAAVAWAVDARSISGRQIRVQGRPPAHDIGIMKNDNETKELGAALEIKWLRSPNQIGVAKDVVRLMLSRGCSAEQSALRTYLVIGGDSSSFRETLRRLWEIGIRLRWSRAGRGGTWPSTTTISLQQLLTNPECCQRILRPILERGKYIKNPPEAWDSFRAVPCFRWEQSVPALCKAERMAWKFVTWEFNHRGVGGGKIDWESIKPHFMT